MRSDFLGGVVEGFYGQPWTQTQRYELFDQMATWGLNAYFYAPKDDLKHRAIWREEYNESELADLAELVAACRRHQLVFIYGLSPGLDIRFSQARELENIQRRFQQLINVGTQHFALLFDDLPGAISDEDRTAFPSVAAAQSSVTNATFEWLRQSHADRRLLFCPTPYCDRMASWHLGGVDYLETIGRALHPEIDVLWTGPEIISREISVASILSLTERIRRPPVIWDNLHANDYDLRRAYCGPYSGRPLELRNHVRGILSNPNNEFPLNFVPLSTLAEFVNCDSTYEPRAAYLTAIHHWFDGFDTVRATLTFEDLLLLADCYYLPHEEGPSAQNLFQVTKKLLTLPVDQWGESFVEFQSLHDRVQRMFAALTELRNRELFYAWSRRVWELKEELDLLNDILVRKQNDADCQLGIFSETHLPQTYRGGMVARLQRELEMDENGIFRIRS